jgi:enediyne biosynthesis protein E4
MRFCAVALLFAVLFCACGEKKEPALFEKIHSTHSGIQFVNTVSNTEELNIFNYRNFYNGGGVAIGDLNNDGLADVFFTSNMGDNKLYLNRGDFRFEDITAKAGVAGTKDWSTGVVLADVNSDGLLDIFVCNAGYFKGKKPEKELFINQGTSADGIPVFVEKAAEYGLNEAGYTTHAAFFDYDGDGDLDCYILNNSFLPVNTLNYSNKRELYAQDWPVADFVKGGGDKLLRNDAIPPPGGKKGGFTDVTKQAGIYGSLIGFGLGVTVGDINGDHWPDIYVSNDFFERDYLYINKKNGVFNEEIEGWMEHLSHASMGADMADINNDGYPEIFTTEMLPSDEYRLKTTTSFENYNIYQLKQQRGFYHQYMQNSLQLNNQISPTESGGGAFSEIAFQSGVAASDWSWGALLFDMDNDGYRDIYICNGIYKDVIDQDFIDFFADEIIQKMAITGKKEEIEKVIEKMPSVPISNKVFRNRGDLTFEDVGQKWGFGLPTFSNGAAYGDLDNDGDLDLVVNNVNMEALVYRNKSESISPKNHFLRVELKGDSVNTFAVGAKVYVYNNGAILNTELIPCRGFQSSVDYKMVFGLGTTPAVDSLVVVWHDRKKTVVPQPVIDQLLVIDHGTARGMAEDYLQASSPKNKRFEEVSEPFSAHREDGFIDFYQEGLNYRMVSREGPKAAVGDVNGDGTDDVFIGGAAGGPGQLYLQKGNGFARAGQKTFDPDSIFEDTAVLFFDADGDKDLDLFVGSGGNHHPTGSRFMQDRVYLNDGKGQFALHAAALPVNGYNTAVAVPLDFDDDGDADLFVGSRSVPGVYAVPPKQFLYENDGKGNFREVMKTAAPDLKTIGMVTDAVLADVSGDERPELLIAGEWMAPQIFEVGKGKLTKIPSNLDQYSGWWYAVAAEDIDGDGDKDLILGNRGENFYFGGSKEAPAKIWVWDFDNNGTVEKIITRTVNGLDMPVLMKKELTAQLPELKKQNLRHSEYAKKSLDALLKPEILKKAMMREGNYFKSAVALNNGNNQFSLIPLPKEVQFSCIKAIFCTDLDGDGKKDLVLGGNDSGFMPQFSKLDASFGHVLLNKGNGNFETVENRVSGFFVRGDVKQLAGLKKGKEHRLMALVNNQKPKIFKIN